MAKGRITQIVPHDSPVTRFLMPKISATTKMGSPPVEAPNAGRGRLDAGAVAVAAAADWLISTRSVVDLVRSQGYHTERPPCLFEACSP